MVNWKAYWSAIGVGGLLIIGVLFFFFPEPVTSVLGIALILVAAFIWLAGWVKGDRPTERHTVVEER